MRLSGLTFMVVALNAFGPTGRHADTSFTAVQPRGRAVMGVDQYGWKHVFEDLPNGGRIVLDRMDSTDTSSIRRIREHMRGIADAFRRGDFRAPGLVHARKVPGTDVMQARRDDITYVVLDRPSGAEVRIVSSDRSAIAATHQFLAFQRLDHRSARHEMPMGH